LNSPCTKLHLIQGSLKYVVVDLLGHFCMERCEFVLSFFDPIYFAGYPEIVPTRWVL
jgi:hypothetical protein